MTTPEIVAILATVTIGSAALIAYILWVVRTSGSDRKEDPELVRSLIDEAPYDRISNILPR